jgi:hypothetical protein
MRPVRWRSVLVVTSTTAILVGGCAGDGPDRPELPNPAAVYCEEQGGRTSGPEPMCTLPDGTVVDAWDQYRAALDPSD